MSAPSVILGYSETPLNREHVMSMPCLRHITTTRCPDCGCAEVTQATVRDQHSNGHWNEILVFRCGFRQEFSPNFMAVSVQGECEKQGSFALRKKNMEKARKAAVDAILPYLAKGAARREADLMLGSTFSYFNIPKFGSSEGAHD